MTDPKTAAPENTAAPTPERVPEVKTQLLDQLNTAQPSARANVTEVFDRMNAASLLLDQVDREADAPKSGREGGNSADPSIEEYMSALLARSNGFSKAAATQVLPKHVLPPQAEPAVESKPPTPAQSAVDTPAAEAWIQKPAPECRDDLSNMRKLANLNARSALDTHSGRRLIFEMHNKLTVALVAIVLSFGLITAAHSIRSLAYIGAVASLTTSCVWSMRYLALARQLSNVRCDRTPQPPPVQNAGDGDA